MAFVGFKTSSAGDYVVRRFNGTFMGSLKLAVEPAKAVESRGGGAGGDAMSQEKKSAAVPTVSGSKRKAEAVTVSDAGRAKPGYLQSDAMKNNREDDQAPDAKAKRREEFVNRRLHGAQGTTWASEILAPDAPALPSEAEQNRVEGVPEGDDEAAPPVDLNAVSDLDFLASLAVDKPAAAHEEEPCNRGTSDAADEPQQHGDESGRQHACTPSGADLVRETRRIRVTNIPFTATEAEVKNFFSSSFGPVAEVLIPLTKDTKQSKGAAYVTFSDPHAAEQALVEGHMCVFMGRLIRVEASAPPPAPKPLGGTDGDGGTAMTDGATGGGPRAGLAAGLSSFKQARAEEQKKKDSALNWNSLYMQSHAAVATMAQRLNVDRKEIVSLEHSGAAVRAAVAEAILTSEAKNVLGDEGINFDAINGAESRLGEQRSNTTILVKNLLPGADLADLAKMFKRFGPLETIACPTGAAFALFAYSHAQDARTAFQRLAYKKFGGSVLFLEWAPLGSIVDADGGDDSTVLEKLRGRGSDNDDGHGGDDGAAASAATAAHTLYITNLPFGVSEDALRVFLLDAAPRLAARGGAALRRISLLADKGRAFVDLADAESLEYARAKVNGRKLDGRAVAAVVAAGSKARAKAPAEAGATPAEAPSSSSGSRAPPGCDPLKIIVKNLPFEATEADLRELVKAFSEVKAVRVPKKIHTFSSHRENNHRGFGFVEFLTEEEAARALRTLSNTHLYGRHLVLQYAKAGDSS